jgi:hypothetical protein
MSQVRATVAGREFTFDSSDIVRRVGRLLPEPLADHYVVIAGRRFPPKQVVGLVTGLDRADFNTHQARQILRRLGFTVSRRSRTATVRNPDRPGPHGGREADLLRPFMGQWVAQRGLDVLVAASTPEEVLRWLERHDQRADAVFLVPRDEAAATGGAPQ